MRKLYMAIAAFAALMFSQIGHATPSIPGATDIATSDGDTYYALIEQAGGWVVNGYTADGAATGFSVQLSANGNNISSNKAKYFGLAFDGTNFYALRNDLASAINRDSYSVLGFDLSGAKSSVMQFTNAAGDAMLASKAVYSGLSKVEEGFFALRNDLQSAKNTDSWSLINFTDAGVLNKSGNLVSFQGALASIDSFDGVASFNQSPATHQLWENKYSVPEPSTGLLIGSIFALGLIARKRSAK